MPRNPSRSRSREAPPHCSDARTVPGADGTDLRRTERRGPDAFRRVFEMVTRAADGEVGAREAREELGDLVRVSARVRALEKRLGKRGAAELSPYLQSLLRVAGESRVVEPARLRLPA